MHTANNKNPRSIPRVTMCLQIFLSTKVRQYTKRKVATIRIINVKYNVTELIGSGMSIVWTAFIFKNELSEFWRLRVSHLLYGHAYNYAQIIMQSNTHWSARHDGANTAIKTEKALPSKPPNDSLSTSHHPQGGFTQTEVIYLKIINKSSFYYSTSAVIKL